MAIVDLGTFNMVTGALPVTFNSFSYNQNRAYAINVIMTSTDFNQVFSYIRIVPLVSPNGGVPFVLNDPQTLEIIPINQLFYFSASTLFDSNGTVEFRAERLPRWRGAGDARPMTLQLTYDDSLFTSSWR
jgi:hypothetical protein